MTWNREVLSIKYTFVVCVRVYVCLYVCLYVWVCVCVCVCVCVYTGSMSTIWTRPCHSAASRPYFFYFFLQAQWTRFERGHATVLLHALIFYVIFVFTGSMNTIWTRPCHRAAWLRWWSRSTTSTPVAATCGFFLSNICLLLGLVVVMFDNVKPYFSVKATYFSVKRDLPQVSYFSVKRDLLVIFDNVIGLFWQR
jgi:hypothetical protein